MATILLLETSAASLSAALSVNGTVTVKRVCTEPRQQASLAAPMVKEVLAEAGIPVSGCDAVCVSKGPGSYTGLRVGVSTAKGLCFGAGIPLLSVGTLDILVQPVIQDGPKDLKYIVPMIDARRMEVYTAVFSPQGKQLSAVEASLLAGTLRGARPICGRRRHEMQGGHHLPQRPVPGSRPPGGEYGRPGPAGLRTKKVRRLGVLRTLLSERFRDHGLQKETVVISL